MQTALVIVSFCLVLFGFATYDIMRLKKEKAKRDYQFELFERLVWAVEKGMSSEKVGLNDERAD